jgi:hypothetical protein
MLYVFDRLGNHKLSQAYNFLVPEKNFYSKNALCLAGVGAGAKHENSSHLRTSIVGQAKRRSDHRQPDNGAE